MCSRVPVVGTFSGVMITVMVISFIQGKSFGKGYKKMKDQIIIPVIDPQSMKCYVINPVIELSN